jgi:hypothetical protein
VYFVYKSYCTTAIAEKLMSSNTQNGGQGGLELNLYEIGSAFYSNYSVYYYYYYSYKWNYIHFLYQTQLQNTELSKIFWNEKSILLGAGF